MKVLRNIEISYEELNFYFNNYTFAGRESVVYINNKDNIARKIFRKNFGQLEVSYDEKELTRENKEKKITFLHDIDEFDNEVKILSTISCDKVLVGYDSTYLSGYQTLSSSILSKKENKHFLLSTKQKLEYFHELEIVYGDVTGNNILINKRTGEVAFCDLDNVQIKEYPIDIFNSFIFPFCNDKNLISPNIDTYMHNLLLLNELDPYYDGYQEIMLQLERGYRPKYLKREAGPTLRKMINANSCYLGDSLMDYIKK